MMEGTFMSCLLNNLISACGVAEPKLQLMIMEKQDKDYELKHADLVRLWLLNSNY